VYFPSSKAIGWVKSSTVVQEPGQRYSEADACVTKDGVVLPKHACQAFSLLRESFEAQFWITGTLILDDIRVIEWISTVSGCQVQELVLDIMVKRPLVFPCTLFTFESLKRLKLHVDSILKFPAQFFMSSLKVLHLDFITSCCDEAILQVCLSCLVLEKLVLISCKWNIKVVNIYAPALKNMTFDDFYADDDIYDCEIKIHAESLITLDWKSNFAYKDAYHGDRFGTNGSWTLEAIPQPFLPHLNSVELSNFDGNEKELLKNARALLKVTIRSSSTLSANPKKKFGVLMQLLMLPRVSTCVIDIS
ncbi:hypothetical protein IFM89_015804, partial [Coptis chinensis]